MYAQNHMKNHQTKTTETKNKCLVTVSEIFVVLKNSKKSLMYTVTNMVGKYFISKSEDLKYCYFVPSPCRVRVCK